MRVSISLIYKIITNCNTDSTDDDLIVVSQPEFELNQFDNDDISMGIWLEEQGVYGVQEIQGGQDQGGQDQGGQGQRVQDRRYPLRQRRATAKAAGLS